MAVEKRLCIWLIPAPAHPPRVGARRRRIPASNLEALVIGRLRDFLADEGAMLSAISDAEHNGSEKKRLLARGRQISEELPTRSADVVRSILTTLVNRIDIKSERVEIRVYQRGFHGLLKAESMEASLAEGALRATPAAL